MSDAMEVLFSYAQDWLKPPLLLCVPEYSEAKRCAAEQEKRLLPILDDEAEKCFKNFMKEQELFLFLENRAMFQAGFRLAMELSR